MSTGAQDGDVTPASYAGGSETYLSAILEQYKLYVEMADRVSSRRMRSTWLRVPVLARTFLA